FLRARGNRHAAPAPGPAAPTGRPKRAPGRAARRRSRLRWPPRVVRGPFFLSASSLMCVKNLDRRFQRRKEPLRPDLAFEPDPIEEVVDGPLGPHEYQLDPLLGQPSPHLPPTTRAGGLAPTPRLG